MMRIARLLPLVLLSGCFGTMPVGTDLNVRRYAGGHFKTCELKLNWSIDDTIAACGEPDASMPRDGGGDCLFYENLSVSLRTADHPAPVMGACFVERTGSHMDPNTRKLVTEDKPVPRLEEIFGLARLPK